MTWLERAKRVLSVASIPLLVMTRSPAHAAPGRRLAFESLEPRLTLAAAGLVSVGTQPSGNLNGKIVFVTPGHGYNWSASAWRTDRGISNEMVEDFGTQDQLALYADYLFRAGATVVPLRPVGRQTNERVLDNQLAVTPNASIGTVTFSDSNGPAPGDDWTDSTTATRWYDADYGATADSVPYRFANTSGPTATVTYTPNISAAGLYPVYTWAAAGSNRTTQIYKVNHTGGETQVTVDHSKVGTGWVYLGTYHFDAGTTTAGGEQQGVVIGNQGPAGKVVIADAIRFGNGMGDLAWGAGGPGTGSTSGKPREEEHSFMWVWRGYGQWTEPADDPVELFVDTDNDGDITEDEFQVPAIMAARMNLSAYGNSVYVGIHSNAFGNSTARGTTALYSTINPTPNQQSLATYFGRQIETDLLALGYDWGARSDTFGGAYGEINNVWYKGEMDSTIIEVAFHTNPEDAAVMKSPLGRDQMARSMYEATVEYFDHFGAAPQPPNLTLPSAPTNVRAVSNSSGQVTISWTAGPTSDNGYIGANGSPATGFRVYASSDGYGFDGGTPVDGVGTTSATLTGLDPTLPYYFKVVAANTAGESKATEVVTALPSGDAKQVLIVGGFDRFDESQNFQYSTALVLPNSTNVTTDRVWPRYNNSFDYVVQVHSAIHAAKPGVHVASTSNEAVISGAVNLTDYDVVIWILGEESTVDDTFNATEQTKVQQFIAAGGHLFLSGSEIAWDLDQQNNGRSFFENTLKGNYVADDAGTYTATAAAGGIFAGMSSFVFSNGSSFSQLDSQRYNVDFPDVVAPQAGAVSALTYSGGTGGTAAIQVQGTGGAGNIVMFGFPFEAMTNETRRINAMGRILDFFNVTPAVDNADFNGNLNVDAADYVVWRKFNGTTVPAGTLGDANFDARVENADYSIFVSQFGTTPGGAASGGATSASGDAASHDIAFSELTAGVVAMRAASRPAARPPATAVVAQGKDWATLLSAIAQPYADEGKATDEVIEFRLVKRNPIEFAPSAKDLNLPEFGFRPNSLR